MFNAIFRKLESDSYEIMKLKDEGISLQKQLIKQQEDTLLWYRKYFILLADTAMVIGADKFAIDFYLTKDIKFEQVEIEGESFITALMPKDEIYYIFGVFRKPQFDKIIEIYEKLKGVVNERHR